MKAMPQPKPKMKTHSRIEIQQASRAHGYILQASQGLHRLIFPTGFYVVEACKIFGLYVPSRSMYSKVSLCNSSTTWQFTLSVHKECGPSLLVFSIPVYYGSRTYHITLRMKESEIQVHSR